MAVSVVLLSKSQTGSPGSEVIKLFSCSTQANMKFQLFIKTKMLKNTAFSCFQTLRCCIYHANNVKKCQKLLAFQHL